MKKKNCLVLKLPSLIFLTLLTVEQLSNKV